MWGRIALFELRYQLRRPIALVSFLIFLALGFALAVLLALANTGSIAANAPFWIVLAHASLSILAMFLSIATIADVALRDAATGMDAILRTKPVRRAPYLAARFVGAFAIAGMSLAGATLGMMVGNQMPGFPPDAVIPVGPAPYAFGFLVVALPNLFVTSALFFAVAAFSRSLLATYLSALVVFILYIVLAVLLADPAYRTIAALADPFGQQAVVVDALYWTNNDYNTLLPPLDGLLLWNRLLWIAVAVSLLTAAVLLFDVVGRGWRYSRVDLEKAAASPVMRERPRIVPGGAGTWDQLRLRTGFEVRTVLWSWTFLALLVLSLVACVGFLVLSDQVQNGIRSLPVTYVVIDAVAAAFGIAAVLVPVAYAGELIWRDRSVKIASIIDATPTPTFVFVVSKLIAVAASILLLFGLLMVTAISYQWLRGVTDINLGFYLVRMLAVIGLPALLFGVLALFIQTVVNRKYVALLIVLVIIVVLPFGPSNKLFVLFNVPNVPLSDMNRYGHFLAATLWFGLYWTCVAVLIGIAASLLWVRGTGSLWTRIRQSRQAMSPAVASLAGLALAGAAASGGYIYWNTHVLNEFMTASEVELLRVAYEKAYRGKENEPQPRITRIDIDVDLYPGDRAFGSRGRYTLVNPHDQPIEYVHIMVLSARSAEVALQDAEQTNSDPRNTVFEFRPRTPFRPGETRTLTFALTDAKPGFGSASDTTIVFNGSFAHSSDLAPLIGVQPRFYLQDWKRRRAHGLEPLPAMARRNDSAQRRRNFISADADFIPYAITVSTDADQIALAPGSLEREWAEDGRRFFRYSIDTPVVNFWAVVSARYAVARDKWNDVDLAVYYEPRHGGNVPRMLDAMKQSLAYYAENFGPFPHRQLRIAEFPRYASFAQSFPTLIPYSESIGFIADLSDTTRIDFVWHVTAHEVAHQWWGHQVVGANVEGAQFLSESLSEYSALMVAEKRYGPHRMRQFLKHELDAYLSRRGQRGDERPLARAAMDQTYVHYQKGSLTLYALKDAIGEAALNRALARLLREHGGKSNPYPTSLDLLAILRAEARQEHLQFITDLFERITLWDLRVTGAQRSQTANGTWRVRIDVRARKLDAAGNGKETEVPLDQPIDIGLFTADPGHAEFQVDDVILLEKRQIKSGDQSLEFEVNRKPSFVGVDPYVKLISRNTARNVMSFDD